MFNFDFKKSEIFEAVKIEERFLFKHINFLKKIFLAFFIIILGLFLYEFIFDKSSQQQLSILLGVVMLCFSLTGIFWIIELFINSSLKKPKLKIKINTVILSPDEYNLAEFLSFNVARAVWKSLKFKNSNNLLEVNSSLLLYYLLSDNQKLIFIFSRAILSINQIKEILRAHFKVLKPKDENKISGKEIFPQINRYQENYSEDFQITILEALKIAQKNGHERIEIGDVLCALAETDLVFKKILIDADLKSEDLENLTLWLEYLEKKIEEKNKFWEWKILIKKGSLAKEWTAGYTITLDKFSVDISEVVKRQGFPEIIGHQKEIESMERILARRESNNDVLVVGESGSGRKSMIYALAERSILGQSLPEVNYKRIVMLDLPTILAQKETTEEIEIILDTIFKEVVAAGNVILVIDEFHNYVGLNTVKAGVIDISGIIYPYISSPNFQIVAITTFEGLHKNIEQNSSILSLFEIVEVSEITERETLILLENMALNLEAKYKYKKYISYQALRDIIKYSNKYFQANPFPEKAMDLLDECMVYLAQRKEKILLPSHVAKIVAQKTQTPVGEIETKEREVLLNLEKLIHQRIINQEEAVNEVSAALRRARAEVTTRKGPMGCFLFLGPTGVGKTETAKALAEIYFGSEDKMITLDMSEFQDISDIPRLIGASGQEGLLTTKVRENPFSLILLDEIEKAHPNILNLFLQVLDEGRLTDGLGRKVDFKNTIIIATSNAGYQIILDALKQEEKEKIIQWQSVKPKLLEFLFKEGIFRPEFINRFDSVIVFKPLTKENLLDIAELMLKKIKKNLKEKEIEFLITEELKEKIVELSYDPKFGAREMERVIQDKVENPFAEAILRGELRRGSRVEIDPKEFKIKPA